ncbi:MAG: LAGLIDADG family homing endonuclease [Candidatus Omnitrophica bacterium]|nr:LAGLIDADG family homing endonuclease [Candidatus Omnitrophota bacterium]
MSRKEIEIPENRLKDFYEKQRLSIRKLAKIYTCSATTIQRRLHQYNIRVRPSMSVRLNIPKNRIKFLYEKQRKSTTHLAKIYSCSFKTILNRLREYNIKTRDISEAHIKYPKNDFSGGLIEKAYLIGFRLGDLYVHRYERNGKVISVECASTRPEQIRLIHNLFKNYGYVRITPSDKNGIISIQCGLNPSFNFLLDKEDKIEPWILSSDKLFFAFLAGYIDAEGDVGVYSKNVATLRVGTYDRNILSQVQNRLINRGIDSTLRIDTPKGTKINLPNGRTYSNKKEYKTNCDFWRLAVYKKKALLKLSNRITPYIKHQRIKEGLLKVEKNIHWRNKEFGNLRMG